MKNLFEEHLTRESGRALARAGFEDTNMAARASMVNRTHRVVRERAKMMKSRRRHLRSLWIPMAVCSALLLMICSSVWTGLDGYELTPMGIPDASDQFLVLLLWFFPVSMALLVMVWLRRTRKRPSGGAAQ